MRVGSACKESHKESQEAFSRVCSSESQITEVRTELTGSSEVSALWGMGKNGWGMGEAGILRRGSRNQVGIPEGDSVVEDSTNVQRSHSQLWHC